MSTKEKMTMEEEFQAILKKNLPEHVCGIVKEELAKLEGLQKDLIAVSTKLDTVTADRDNLSKLELDAKAIKEGTNSLERDRKNLREEKAVFERDKLVFELEQKLLAEQRCTAHTMEVNSQLTRNVEYRKELYSTRAIHTPAHTDANGNYQSDQYKTDTDSVAETNVAQ